LSATAKGIGLLAGVLLVGGAAGAVGLSRRPPEFYAQALQQPPDQSRQRARDFLRHASQLASDIENLDRWEAAFRQEDVNAWLAEDFARQHAGLLPESVHEPRVDFVDGRVLVAFRKGTGWLAPVISLKLALWFPEPNLLAVELCDSRAGALPLSTTGALRQAAARTARLGWDVQWKQRDGNPVAMLRLHWDQVCEQLAVEDVRVEEGTFYVAGTSKGCDGGAMPAFDRKTLRLQATEPPLPGAALLHDLELAVKPASR
jgi:hypothetical protein